MTGIPDELVDRTAFAILDCPGGDHLSKWPLSIRGKRVIGYCGQCWGDALDTAVCALTAVGLPALLERVEAAEEQVRQFRGLARARVAQLSAVLDDRDSIEAERDTLAAKVADAGERIALAIEKANRKVIDARVADINAKPYIVDRVLTYAAQVARTEGTAMSDQIPTDHGSDRYDYVEVIGAPPDVQPSGAWFDQLLAEACPDCRANVFVTWAPQEAASWTVTIAHDETCPTPHLTEGTKGA